jgi:hypothetical protein
MARLLKRALERPASHMSPGRGTRRTLPMLFYGVVSDSTEEAVELFTSRKEAEAIVQAWNRDEPDEAGTLRVERIEFRTGTAN